MLCSRVMFERFFNRSRRIDSDGDQLDYDGDHGDDDRFHDLVVARRRDEATDRGAEISSAQMEIRTIIDLDFPESSRLEGGSHGSVRLRSYGRSIGAGRAFVPAAKSKIH